MACLLPITVARRDSSLPLMCLLEGPVAAALLAFVFSRKHEVQGAAPGACGCRDCGAVQAVRFEAAVGTGVFAFRCGCSWLGSCGRGVGIRF